MADSSVDNQASQWSNQEWLVCVKTIWLTPEDMKRKLRNALNFCFSSVSNPFYTLLFLCKELHREKLQFAVEVVKCFESWLLTSKFQEDRNSITIDMKQEVFHIATKSASLPLFSKFESIFQLSKSQDIFKTHIDEMILQGDNAVAAMIISVLKLQDSFDFTSIIIPLLMLDQLYLVESYVKDNKDLQIKLISILDAWAAMRSNQLLDHLQKSGFDTSKKGFKLATLDQRQLGKITMGLVKKFGLNEEEVCPLLLVYRETGFLRYQTREFLFRQAVDEQTWAENVESVVRRRPEMSSAIVKILVDFKDFYRASKWAKKLDLPRSSLPSEVIENVDTLPKGAVTFGNTPRGAPIVPSDATRVYQYHQFPLDFSAIVVVDTKEKYRDFLDQLVKDVVEDGPSKKVGVDAEWPPQYGQFEGPKVSWLQIGFGVKVFLVDIMVLSSLLSDEDWNEGLGRKFIANPRICKLGFGLDEDLKILVRTVPSLTSARAETTNIVDLSKVGERLSKQFPVVLFGEKTKSDGDVALGAQAAINQKPSAAEASSSNASFCTSYSHGLAGLVKTLFGKPLDKKLQCSDWNRRPLRESQMIYAALNAICLVQIFNELEKRISKHGLTGKINLEKISFAKQTEKELREKQATEEEKQRRKERKEMFRSRNYRDVDNVLQLDRSRPTLAPKFLSVVCDTMLQGLGRQLRLCGCDVKILTNLQDHDEAAKIALAEDKTILTSGKTFERLRRFVPEGRCVHVDAGLAKLQCQRVLQQFNVEVKPTDIFSRCQMCNCDQWTVVQSGIIFHLWEQNVEPDKRKLGKPEDFAHNATGPRWAPVANTESRNGQQERKVFWSNPGSSCDKLEIFSQFNIKMLTADAQLHCKALGIDFDDCTFTSKISNKKHKLDLTIIPKLVFENVENFYICSLCAKVYWDGLHFKKTNSIYSDILGFDIQPAMADLKVDSP